VGRRYILKGEQERERERERERARDRDKGLEKEDRRINRNSEHSAGIVSIGQIEAIHFSSSSFSMALYADELYRSQTLIMISFSRL